MKYRICIYMLSPNWLLLYLIWYINMYALYMLSLYNSDEELADGEMFNRRKGLGFFCKYASLIEIQEFCVCF